MTAEEIYPIKWSEEKLSALFQLSDDMVGISDLDGFLKKANFPKNIYLILFPFFKSRMFLTSLYFEFNTTSIGGLLSCISGDANMIVCIYLWSMAAYCQRVKV